MTPESFGTFVNYLGGDFKHGRHKSDICAHAARLKHAQIRRNRSSLKREDSSSTAQTQDSTVGDGEVDELGMLAFYEEESNTTMDTDLVHMGPPTSLSPYYDFFHLLLPPAFFGLNIPVAALIPAQAISTEAKFRKFAYLNSIFYHEVLSYIFDADTIYLRQVDQCIKNTQMFSYAVCAMIQLMQYWTVSENSGAPPYVLESAARAMSRIRKALSDATTAQDDMMLLELTSLASLTHVLRDTKAYDLHRNMLLEIVKRRGGFQALGNVHLAQMISKTCQIQTLDTALQPVFNHDLISSAYNQQASFLSNMTDLVNSLPIGFQNLSRHTPLSTRAIRLLDRFTQLAAARDPDTHLRKHSHFPKTYSSFANGAPDTIRLDFGSPSCEKLLDLTITLYARVGFGRRPASNTLFLTSRVHLNRAIRLFDVRTEAHREFHIWVWTVTIDAWYLNNNVLAPVGQSLLEDLKTRYPETADFSYVHNILMKFFWTPELTRFSQVYW